jgi:hypothetical protein
MEYNVMSHAVIANDQDPPEQSPLLLAPTASVRQSPPHNRDMNCVPELSRLVRLRDALLVLKSPLSSSSDWRNLLEQQLLSNDAHERILGKLVVTKPLPPVSSG